MMFCPICKSQGTLRRGHVAAAGPGYTATTPDARYFAVCIRCGSQFSVPPHEYFQLYSRQSERRELSA